MEPLSPERFKVQFTAGRRVRDKLERLRELLRHVNPNGDLEAVVERALDALLDRIENERFGKTARPRSAVQEAQPPGDGGERTGAGQPSGYIGRAVRREVWERDGERCAYVSPAGKRCDGRAFLELHHAQTSFAFGGEATAANLRVFCAVHNRYAAEQELGAQRVARKIETSRRAAANQRRVRHLRDLMVRFEPSVR